MARIYLDHAATTPMRPEAISAVQEGMRRWANPSSPHAEGRTARAALEDARARIKAALAWDGELIFTSGASEALALAMSRAKVERRLISAVEHDSVFRAAPDATVLPIGRNGQVDRGRLAEALRSGGRALVAVQSVNSETGTMQPVGELASMVRESGGLLLSDCAQSAGKFDLPDADMIVISAHKLGGPPGIGALLVRDLGALEASGGQEFGYRGGTENLPGALGFAAAAERPIIFDDRVHEAIHALINEVVDAPVEVGSPPFIGVEGTGSPHIQSLAMPGVSAAAQLIRFDAAGFSVSAGSACASGSLKSSRTLTAFGVPKEVAARTIRVSVGWNTTADEIHAFRQAWLQIAEAGRAHA